MKLSFSTVTICTLLLVSNALLVFSYGPQTHRTHARRRTFSRLIAEKLIKAFDFSAPSELTETAKRDLELREAALRGAASCASLNDINEYFFEVYGLELNATKQKKLDLDTMVQYQVKRSERRTEEAQAAQKIHKCSRKNVSCNVSFHDFESFCVVFFIGSLFRSAFKTLIS